SRLGASGRGTAGPGPGARGPGARCRRRLAVNRAQPPPSQARARLERHRDPEPLSRPQLGRDAVHDRRAAVASDLVTNRARIRVGIAPRGEDLVLDHVLLEAVAARNGRRVLPRPGVGLLEDAAPVQQDADAKSLSGEAGDAQLPAHLRFRRTTAGYRA